MSNQSRLLIFVYLYTIDYLVSTSISFPKRMLLLTINACSGMDYWYYGRKRIDVLPSWKRRYSSSSEKNSSDSFYYIKVREKL